MSAHYTKPGVPPFPVTSTGIADYAKACYDAGRADHIAEVGQMAPLTDEQVHEIALRFKSMSWKDFGLAVVRATENAHGIASPKEAAFSFRLTHLIKASAQGEAK